jgi:hypothetical protein
VSISFILYIYKDDTWTWPSGVRERMSPELIPPIDDAGYAAWRDSDTVIPNPLYDCRLDFNITNRNAEFVLNELGFHNGDIWDCTPIALTIFEAGLQATMARNPAPIPGIAGYDSDLDGSSKGCRRIVQGVADGYANRQFDRFVSLIEAAREYGATHIGWG